MPDRPPETDTRTRVLDAAERIVQQQGVPALTLAAAAREAGVSKGGLLYHFASKEALLRGMIERLTDNIRGQFEATLASVPEGTGRVARAVIAWQFATECHEAEDAERSAAILLAAHHHFPELLEPVRLFTDDIRARLRADGLKPGRGLAVMAACDGLFMNHVFGMYRPDAADLAALHETLLSLLEPA
ncbi:TetR/AcrR family transcriptional regulator [Rhodovarius crocodyli]|uniref:TetR/AcrR family transcriptional regulator n=1 Tax=Rhodovarius crocodyli TaxID=1979269 RepID=A0A437MFE8_9PROT|nr:TetR/AcrR family transcriptional regulator [Rhodovarius crocodyli]RVT96378.1 TetR/AcrR family transcriptional regulator [Rhodovarius crocodyli]